MLKRQTREPFQSHHPGRTIDSRRDGVVSSWIDMDRQSPAVLSPVADEVRSATSLDCRRLAEPMLASPAAFFGIPARETGEENRRSLARLYRVIAACGLAEQVNHDLVAC